MLLKKIPFVMIILVLGLSACSSATPTGNADSQSIAMASMDGMPADVQAAPATVQQAYQYAVANPDMLEEIPCYCGCGGMGHTSNYACYVLEADAQGTVIQYDSHALGCSICVDITQDVLRLQREGQSLPEIRTYIDNTYAQYGPSNIP
jgi:hypothetical protein